MNIILSILGNQNCDSTVLLISWKFTKKKKSKYIELLAWER